MGRLASLPCETFCSVTAQGSPFFMGMREGWGKNAEAIFSGPST